MILALRRQRQRQVDLCEWEAILVYRVSCMVVRAGYRDAVLKRKKNSFKI